MSSYFPEPPRTRPTSRRTGLITLIVLVGIVLFSARYLASILIEYDWWTELHQTETWVNLFFYGTGPVAAAAVIYFALFFLAFRFGARRNSFSSPLRTPLVQSISAALLLLLALWVANITVNNWTVVRYLGSLQVPATRGEFVDPVFGRSLHFYFFNLPFYSMLLALLLTASALVFAIYAIASNAQSLTRRLGNSNSGLSFEFQSISLTDFLESTVLRTAAALFLLGLAVHYYLARYGLLFEDHGSYLTGIDWVADHVALPLQWLLILGAIVAAVLVYLRRIKFALFLLLLIPIRYVVPSLVAAVYVRPNELALEKRYIQHHIEATRDAFNLNRRVHETTLEANSEIPLDYKRHRATLDNVRLWDWRAFHDTVSQIQPLRPYVYTDTDVDRYNINGQLRQVLITPRELDIRQLGDARNRWINPHLIYTHGYGVVMAEANRITADGLPVLFIQDAPPVVNTRSLRFTKPEMYFSEVAHEPVFVDTRQQEFNYPSGGSQQTVGTTYKGAGGFPLSIANRLAAALTYGDPNILITGYLTGSSRMMIHRAIRERLATLAGFISWEQDPYVVVTESGRLVWIVDGYMSSNQHPYARSLDLGEGETVNYIRNSVKATVDAYSGETHLYVFDPDDVLIQAYRKLLPDLFEPASSMPPDLRTHTRYPELLFNAQAEIYRTFHMRDPESFYNKSDLWDLARTGRAQNDTTASPVQATYVVANLPGEPNPEFLLITPFTPANKNNLIGFMAARCDGEHLGELVFEQLAKQTIVYGPLQIDARINQDQTISKDLSLWNQQGSQVLRGQTLVLPIENTFLYVAPIYIQASQASMPQLKKVALAMGNLLAYADTYEQALAELVQASGGNGSQQLEAAQAPRQASTAPVSAPAKSEQTLQQIRDHLDRYRQLSSQGKWADAGKELDEIQRLVH